VMDQDPVVVGRVAPARLAQAVRHQVAPRHYVSADNLPIGGRRRLIISHCRLPSNLDRCDLALSAHVARSGSCSRTSRCRPAVPSRIHRSGTHYRLRRRLVSSGNQASSLSPSLTHGTSTHLRWPPPGLTMSCWSTMPPMHPARRRLCHSRSFHRKLFVGQTVPFHHGVSAQSCVVSVMGFV
jgi:hypothetical protein